MVALVSEVCWLWLLFLVLEVSVLEVWLVVDVAVDWVLVDGGAVVVIVDCEVVDVEVSEVVVEVDELVDVELLVIESIEVVIEVADAGPMLRDRGGIFGPSAETNKARQRTRQDTAFSARMVGRKRANVQELTSLLNKTDKTPEGEGIYYKP